MAHWIPNIGYISYYAMFRGYSKEPSQRNACFCVFQTHIFARLGPSVRLENDNFLIQFYNATKLLLAQTTESSL